MQAIFSFFSWLSSKKLAIIQGFAETPDGERIKMGYRHPSGEVRLDRLKFC